MNNTDNQTLSDFTKTVLFLKRQIELLEQETDSLINDLDEHERLHKKERETEKKHRNL